MLKYTYARENVEYLLNYLNLLPILFTHIATKTVSLLFIEFEFLQITPSEIYYRSEFK